MERERERESDNGGSSGDGGRSGGGGAKDGATKGASGGREVGKEGGGRTRGGRRQDEAGLPRSRPLRRRPPLLRRELRPRNSGEGASGASSSYCFLELFTPFCLEDSITSDVEFVGF